MERFLEVQLLVCSIKVCHPYEGKLLSLKQCEVDDSGKRLPNCIQFQYRVSVETDTTLSEQDYINHVLEREIDLFLQSLSLLLMRPSHLISYKAKLDDTDVKFKPPPQDAPLGLYSLAAMWSRRSHTRGYSLSVRDNDGWDLLEYIVSEYRQRPIALKKRLALPLHWFAKGSDEFKNTDRLIAFWISFNALYGDPQISSEQRSIENYIQNNVDSVIAQRYVDDNKLLIGALSKLPIELRRGKGKWKIAQDLAALLNTSPRDYISIVKTAALTIYGIRNNLFHGAYNPDSENDRKHIETAEQLLSRLVRELIAKQMLGKSSPIMKLVSGEELAF